MGGGEVLKFESSKVLKLGRTDPQELVPLVTPVSPVPHVTPALATANWYCRLLLPFSWLLPAKSRLTLIHARDMI